MCHGINPLVGGTRNLSNLTEDARSDGSELLGIFESTLTNLLESVYLALGPIKLLGSHHGDRRNNNDITVE